MYNNYYLQILEEANMKELYCDEIKSYFCNTVFEAVSKTQPMEAILSAKEVITLFAETMMDIIRNSEADKVGMHMYVLLQWLSYSWHYR